MVAAGDDAAVTIPQPIALDGSVEDDTAATTQWEKLSGPGTVTFADADAPQTTAAFSTAGSYVLRLIGDDGQIKTFDDMIVTAANSPADQWKLANFGTDAGNPAIAGDFADPDRDGMVNLLEYAFALEPLANSPAPAVALAANEITLTYRRNLLATDLVYLVQEASDFSDWQPANPTNETLSDNGTVRVIRAHVPTGAAPAKFLRIHISRP